MCSKCKRNERTCSRRKIALHVLPLEQIRKEETGFADVKDGIVTEFKEKPVINLGLSECLGIYLLGKDILKKIKDKQEQNEINLSYDILQPLSKER